MSSEAKAFGELYREWVGTGPVESTHSAQRARLLMRYRSRRPVESRWVGWVVGSTAALGLAALLLVLFSPAELEATIAGATLADNAELSAPANDGVPIEFSDGSRMVLQPASYAKLAQVDQEQTRLVLRGGSVTAEIQKHTGTTWTIAAGPYQVRVVGTKFRVDWNEATSQIDVQVSEGKVLVSGGSLPSSGVALTAGEHLQQGDGRVALRGETVTKTSTESPTESSIEPSSANSSAKSDPDPDVKAVDSETSAQPEPREPARRKARPAHRPTHRRRRTPSPSPEESVSPEPASSMSGLRNVEGSRGSSWRALAQAGEYKKALAAAEQIGFDALVQGSSRSDLLLLANAARYARSGSRARQVYRVIRMRFPGTSAAHLSAFYLARLSSDLEGNQGQAVRWLRTYLREAPRGDLAASARARLMDLLSRRGDAAAARVVAGDYLKHHPNGPHAQFARSLVTTPE